ncbi:MAG: HesA/MoeB/ThiF family protein [Magnetococcales bacterium]|nr:HesA/MoeB/ThiF family protein [Magnetococcales bacterium]
MDVLLLGAGGLGSAVALALVGAGITELIIVDDDQVSLSNLHRQVLHDISSVGMDKTASAVSHLCALTDDALSIKTITQRLDTPEAIAAQAAGCRVIVDGTDNFQTRFAANDAALKTGIPLVHGAVVGLHGQFMTIFPNETACLRCLFDGPPDEEGATCRTQGVLGPVVGEMGWWMALEVAKLIHGQGQPMVNRLMTIDFHQGRRREVILRRRAGCSGCGHE